ncbi:MAG: glycosyltransferase family 4 protein [Dehalococcoidia bacterium]
MLNHYATPPDTPGSTRNYDFARELVKLGHRVSILASSFNHRTMREERNIGKQGYYAEKVNGVDFIWLKTSPRYSRNDWRRVLNMISYAARVISLGLKPREKPDVILATWPHPFVGLAGWFLAKSKKVSFILQIHDLWPKNLVEIGGYSSRSPSVKLIGILEKFLCDRASRIIVLMPKGAEYLATLGIPDHKIVYIPNGVSPELFSNTSAGLPEEISELVSDVKSKGKLLIIYAGAHGIANSLNTIVEAAGLIKAKGIDKVHFLLVGDGPEKSILANEAHALGLDNISFCGPVPKYIMPALLNMTDIAVKPGRKSGLGDYGVSPNKLYDYMASAKPIVWSTNSVNNPVEDAGCGLSFPPEDAQAMAQAIVKLCNMSQEERQEMGKRGYDYVMKYHSVPVLAEKLLDVINESPY